MMSVDVSAGAISAAKVCVVTDGYPASPMVGTLGRSLTRLSPVTASALSLPAWMCEITELVNSIINETRLVSRSCMAGAPPR